jgi:hypothetical protein
MQPDTSTEIAMAGLAAFFVLNVLAWIIAFRHYGPRMVETMVTTTPSPDQIDDGVGVRVVEVPVAGAVDGGPLLGGRLIETKMQIADRDTGQRRTVRQMVSPPPSPTSIPAIPDETPPSDLTQQQTQALPAARNRKIAVFYNRHGDRLVVGKLAAPETLPRENWN